MSDPDDIFRKSAAKQRMYMILCGILLFQVVFVGVLFAVGAFEQNRTLIRWVVGFELFVAVVIYLYFRIKSLGSKSKPTYRRKRR